MLLLFSPFNPTSILCRMFLVFPPISVKTFPFIASHVVIIQREYFLITKLFPIFLPPFFIFSLLFFLFHSPSTPRLFMIRSCQSLKLNKYNFVIAVVLHIDISRTQYCILYNRLYFMYFFILLFNSLHHIVITESELNSIKWTMLLQYSVLFMFYGLFILHERIFVYKIHCRQY